MTMAKLRVAASFWKALTRYWRMENLRGELLEASRFLRAVAESKFRGNALLIKVEKESIMMRLVPGSGKTVVGCVRSAIRWARLGVEKCSKLCRRSNSVRAGGGDKDGASFWIIAELDEAKIWESRGPGTGWDASGSLSVL